MLQSVLRRRCQPARLARVGEVARRFSALRTREVIVAYAVEVRYPRIAEIDVAEVRTTDAIVWMEWLPVAKRTPAVAGSTTPAPTPPPTKAKTEAPSRTAKPSHQRRCVPRLRPIRAGYPSPPSADVRPAAVVKRCEAPGCGIHPGPTPRTHPHPLTVAVRRPARSHRGRRPDWTIIRIIFPGSVLIEIFGADYSRRHVAGRNRVIVALVSHTAPFIKAIRLGSSMDLVR